MFFRASSSKLCVKRRCTSINLTISSTREAAKQVTMHILHSEHSKKNSIKANYKGAFHLRSNFPVSYKEKQQKQMKLSVCFSQTYQIVPNHVLNKTLLKLFIRGKRVSVYA